MVKRLTHKDYENRLFQRELDFVPIEAYVSAKVPILHECYNGHTWKASPSNILNGRGCPECAGNKRNTNESYLSKLVERRILDTIPVESIINASTAITHECLKCKHRWKIRPYDVMCGKGCPSCARRGFDTSIEAIVYFVSFIYEDITYYKIGVTNHSVERRFQQYWNKYSMKTEWDILYDTGREALDLEQFLLDKYSIYKINTKAFPNGNTETITVSIPKPKIDLDLYSYIC
jgi:predicted  nucleic acid-binding Zn-ribbon protein